MYIEGELLSKSRDIALSSSNVKWCETALSLTVQIKEWVVGFKLLKILHILEHVYNKNKYHAIFLYVRDQNVLVDIFLKWLSSQGVVVL